MNRTVESEDMTVERLVWLALGTQEDRVIEETLDLNPGLAARGVVLPIGTVVKLPEPRPPVRTVKTTRLWD